MATKTETPPFEDTSTETDLPWQVVVHNDPVNLMSYVTMVFRRIFGYSKEKAEKHMMEVHNDGRSVVWAGSREKAEFYVQQLHTHLLLATLERSSHQAMECYHLKRGGIGLSGIPMVLGHLLQNCPSIGVNSEKAEARLYPNPSEDPFEEHLREDWKTVVEPDLQEHFRSARSVMEADVRNMRIDEDLCTVEIPSAHIDPWISALNQARLSLAAEYDFSERELSGIGPIDIRSERDLALVQINFFAVIQDVLISEASA